MRVLHLAGSATSPLLDELSCLYARDCLAATGAGHDPVVAHVSPGGAWRLPSSLDPADVAAAEPLAPAAALARLDVDVVLPQMFCLPGMTAYRSMWQVLGIPHVGNTGAVMALGADKARARAVAAAAGVAVPPAVLARRGEVPTVDLPVVVKPVDADNSVGVSLVRRPGELAPALDAALAHSDATLVEAYVPGREVRCGIVERGGELVCLPLEEYRLDPDAPIRTAGDKLGRRDGALALMAKDPSVAWIVDPADPITGPVWDLARTCHVALGCRDHSLWDVRVDPDGRPWLLEASLYCSFARQSVLAVMAAAAGTPVTELLADALAAAVARGA